MADGSLKFDTKIDTEGIDKGTRSIKGSLNRFLQSVRNMGRGVEGVFNNTAPIDKTDSKIRMLVDEIDQLSDGLYYLEKQGMYFGDKEYDEAYSKLQRLEKELNTYKKSLAGVDNAQKKTSKSVAKVGKNMDRTTKSTNNGHMSMLKMLKMSLLFSVVFRALSAVTKSIGEGFQNLAQYSKSTNTTMSALATSLLTLKNSIATAFEPILTAIAPALQTLINYMTQAMTTAGQFFAVFLNGANTFTKAKDAQIDYAASLAKTAKEANKSLSPIDKLNSVGDDTDGASGTPGLPEPSQMFETVEIDSKFADMVDGIKDNLTGLFEPIKQSWDTYGQQAINSAKTAFGSIKNLLIEIGSSLETVWLNGTGTETIDNILLIFTGINNTISEIATNFKNAWVNGGTGTAIIQDIWDIINNILGAIQQMTEATATWASGLDFTPILTSFQNLTSSLEPLTGTIADGLVWFYENVLLPLAGWVITDVLPLFLDGLAAVLDIINGVLTNLKPLGLWLFDNFLKPIAEWTGGVITEILGGIVDKLQDFAVWINNNQGIVETIAIVIGSFAAAWGLVNAAILIWNVLGAIATGVTGAFGAAVAILTSPITLVILAIGALIAIIVLLVKNWDTVKAFAIKCWDGIKSAWNAAGEWFNTKIVKPIGNFFSGLWDGIKTGVKTALDTVKYTFKTIFNALIDIVKKPINAIIDIINGMIGGVVNGVNSVIRAINSINFTLPDWVPGIGGKGIGFNIKEFTAPKIPRLATGAVIPPNSEFLALLGDQKRGTNIEAPLDTIVEAFKQVSGSGGNMLHVTLILQNGKVLLDTIVAAENENYNQTGKPLFQH